MAVANAAASTTTESEQILSHRLDRDQTSRAVRALLKHINTVDTDRPAKAEKRNLLAKVPNESETDDETADEDVASIWLLLSTKKFIIDRKPLKPNKLTIPHPLNSSPTSTICLITADPQRPFKDTVDHASFPAPLRNRITRVISVAKLRAKYKSYESRRQLLREHDVFLADDRIINQLPQALGKIFYKSGTKRPVPVCISGGKKAKATSKEGERIIAKPKAVAEELTRTLSTALIHLAPSTSTAIRVAKASWTEDKVVENIEAVVKGVIEKFVPRKWANVKALHIKGPNTVALPLWLADELWIDEKDVLDEAPAEDDKKTIEASKREGRKRKGSEAVTSEGGEKVGKKRRKKDGRETDELQRELASQRERLKKQKVEALAEFA